MALFKKNSNISELSQIYDLFHRYMNSYYLNLKFMQRLESKLKEQEQAQEQVTAPMSESDVEQQIFRLLQNFYNRHLSLNQNELTKNMKLNDLPREQLDILKKDLITLKNLSKTIQDEINFLKKNIQPVPQRSSKITKEKSSILEKLRSIPVELLDNLNFEFGSSNQRQLNELLPIELGILQNIAGIDDQKFEQLKVLDKLQNRYDVFDAIYPFLKETGDETTKLTLDLSDHEKLFQAIIDKIDEFKAKLTSEIDYESQIYLEMHNNTMQYKLITGNNILNNAQEILHRYHINYNISDSLQQLIDSEKTLKEFNDEIDNLITSEIQTVIQTQQKSKIDELKKDLKNSRTELMQQNHNIKLLQEDYNEKNIIIKAIYKILSFVRIRSFNLDYKIKDSQKEINILQNNINKMSELIKHNNQVLLDTDSCINHLNTLKQQVYEVKDYKENKEEKDKFIFQKTKVRKRQPLLEGLEELKKDILNLKEKEQKQTPITEKSYDTSEDKNLGLAKAKHKHIELANAILFLVEQYNHILKEPDLEKVREAYYNIYYYNISESEDKNKSRYANTLEEGRRKANFIEEKHLTSFISEAWFFLEKFEKSFGKDGKNFIDITKKDPNRILKFMQYLTTEIEKVDTKHESEAKMKKANSHITKELKPSGSNGHADVIGKPEGDHTKQIEHKGDKLPPRVNQINCVSRFS